MTSRTGPRKIMIVDDMRTIRMLLPAYFVGKDYRYFPAESGEDALANLGSVRPDLLVSDVNMPGMSGFELCHAARALPGFARLPVILITGDPEIEKLMEELDPTQKSALVTKPLDPQEVRALVEDFLGA